MIKVGRGGCVAKGVGARGSNVTCPPLTRAGSPAWNSGSTRTAPVKYSAGPLADGASGIAVFKTETRSHPFAREQSVVLAQHPPTLRGLGPRSIGPSGG